MAKELPYFKFEPSEWENGSIQIMSHEVKGVFIDLCSMYWQRLGNLPYKLAVQKLCGGNATALDSLYADQIIQIIDGQICIDFLNEQLGEFENTSEQNAENARKGWEKRRKDATVMRPHSNPNAIREEKKKVDEKKEEESIGEGAQNFDDLFLKAFDENTCESYKLAFRGFDLGSELQKFRVKCDNDKAKYYGRDVGGLRTAFQYQLQNLRTNGKRKSGSIEDNNKQAREIIEREFGNKGAT